MMKNSKLGVGTVSVLGAVVAAATLSGCTSSTQTAASGPSSKTSASSSATGSTAAGGTAGASSTATSGTGSQATDTSGAGTGASSSAGTGSCTDAELNVTMSSAGAASGHVGWVLVFTNTGSTPCSVEGYPGVGVTDQPGGVVLNAQREQFGDIGAQYPTVGPVELAPGKAASTILEWVDAPVNGQAPVGANCPGMDSGKVLVTPPNTTQSTAFPAPADLCALLEIHPLVPGTTGRSAVQ
jgi:hypothetical protein